MNENESNKRDDRLTYAQEELLKAARREADALERIATALEAMGSSARREAVERSPRPLRRRLERPARHGGAVMSADFKAADAALKDAAFGYVDGRQDAPDLHRASVALVAAMIRERYPDAAAEAIAAFVERLSEPR